jgi:hypothetical protein
MNLKIFVVLAGIALLAGGCRKTETDTHTFQPWFGKDRAYGRYPRSVEEVYRAAFTVVGRNGVVVNETIPHDTSNNARALYGKVGENKVWMSVQSEEDPKITSIVVQAHTKWGNANIELAHELEKEVALQLQSQSPSSFPSGS